MTKENQIISNIYLKYHKRIRETKWKLNKAKAH